MDLSVDSSVVDVIDPREASEIDQIVEQVIAKYQSNSRDIMRLALETIVTITASEARVKELTNQGFLARAFNSVMGTNNRLRDSIAANLVISQYAAVKLLQRIVEQYILNVKLTSAVHHKLNKLALKLDPETIHDLAQLAGIYEQISSEIAALEARITSLERWVEKQSAERPAR